MNNRKNNTYRRIRVLYGTVFASYGRVKLSTIVWYHTVISCGRQKTCNFNPIVPYARVIRVEANVSRFGCELSLSKYLPVVVRIQRRYPNRTPLN